MLHFANGSYEQLGIKTGLTSAIADFETVPVFIKAFDNYIQVKVNGIVEAEFYTEINKNISRIGFSAHVDNASRFSNVIYSNDASNDSFTTPVEATPPVITVVDPIVSLDIDEPYISTIVATDSADGDVSQFIELYDANNNQIQEIDTSISRIEDFIVKVRDNNFNYAIASQTIQVGITPTNEQTIDTTQEDNRVSQRTQNINLNKSRLDLAVVGDTGIKSYLVQAHNKSDVTDVLINSPVEFNNGVASVELDKSIGFEYVGHVLEGNYPHANGIAIVGATTGEISVFSNEVIGTSFALPQQGVLAIEGNILVDNKVIFTTNSGATCSYKDGYFVFCPNGVYDYLQPNESVVETLEYLMGGNVTQTLSVTILATEALGANVNTTTTELSTVNTFEEGATFEVAFTVTGRTVGEIQPQAIGATTSIPRYSFNRNGREVWHIKIPASCTSIDLVQTGGFDGSVSELHVRELLKPVTVVAPRKLEVFKVNQRQQPLHAPVEGTCVIAPVLIPLYSINEDPNISFKVDISNTALNSSGQRLAYRQIESDAGNHRFVDTFSFESKEGINLIYGGDYTYIDNYKHEGGYPITEASPWNFEWAISFGSGSLGFTKNGYLLNSYLDNKQLSISGQYSTPENTDCIVLNRPSDGNQSEQEYYFFNIALYNGGDGNIDSKCTTLTNYAEFGYTYRDVRAHPKSIQMYCNNKHLKYDETFTGTSFAFWAANIDNRILLFNTEFYGERLVDETDFKPAIQDSELVTSDEEKLVYVVMKTQPAIPDVMKSAFD